MIKTISLFANRISPISLKEMDAVRLLDRVDTKFICPVAMVSSILGMAQDFYKILEIDGRRIMSYQTRYYDTLDFSMYRDHQNGKLNRYKIREREYADSGVSFLEVKLKDNKGRTIKSRTKRDLQGVPLNLWEKKFLSENSPYLSEYLEFKLFNSFKRITLANREERITIDFSVNFSIANGHSISWPSIAIVEIKQRSYASNTPIRQILKKLNISISGGSKYCIGVASLYPEVKVNGMKPLFKTLLKFSRTFASKDLDLSDLKSILAKLNNI